MELPNRKTIRLKGWDYSRGGWYFVTIDTWQKIKYFGQIVNGTMILNEYGNILMDEIMNTPKIRPGVVVDTYQIMPDHWHMILRITGTGEQNLAYIIRGIKMVVAGKIYKCRGALQCARTGDRIWQRNYYERIIRSQVELDRVRDYVRNNPGGGIR